MPNFNGSPSLPVEKIADACILTLVIEMTVGLGLQRINRGCTLCAQEPPPCHSVAIFETILLVLLAIQAQPYSDEASIRGGNNRMLRQDHTLRVAIASGCASFRAPTNCSQAVGLL